MLLIFSKLYRHFCIISHNKHGLFFNVRIIQCQNQIMSFDLPGQISRTLDGIDLLISSVDRITSNDILFINTKHLQRVMIQVNNNIVNPVDLNDHNMI